jgi:glucan phosphorylase
MMIVKQAIRTVLPMFSTCRMMKQYVDEMYAPAFGQARRVNEGD